MKRERGRETQSKKEKERCPMNQLKTTKHITKHISGAIAGLEHFNNKSGLGMRRPVLDPYQYSDGYRQSHRG